MPKFRPNKSGNPIQNGKVTNYTVSIACSILEKSGLSPSDELEIITNGKGKIIIQKLIPNS